MIFSCAKQHFVVVQTEADFECCSTYVIALMLCYCDQKWHDYTSVFVIRDGIDNMS